MAGVRSSVLIVSLRRPEKLEQCLRSLAGQTTPPGEVIVVWQADDAATRDAAERVRSKLVCPLRVVHSPVRGVVPSENAALAVAEGDVVLLIDDDATAPPTWVERHLTHYDDPSVGAVGGPADNFDPEGAPFPKREETPIGKLAWYGKPFGNMYDQAPRWRSRRPLEVDHLVGYNMSLRRRAFDRFEERLRSYWQSFELEACLQVRRRGFRILFDFGNVVSHFPTNTAFAGGREGDLQVKIYNPAFNLALVLAKHSDNSVGAARLAYLLAVGSTARPGLLGALRATARYGNPRREAEILLRTWRSVVEGWRRGKGGPTP